MPSKDQLQAIIDDPGSTPEERAAAQLRLDAITDDQEPPAFSPEVREMLRFLGKAHIRDVTQDEWLRYIQQRSLTIRDPLVREHAQWVPPEKRFMELTGWTAQTYWQWIHDRATTAQVRANALAEIRKQDKPTE
jgi:hypothetical protein